MSLRLPSATAVALPARHADSPRVVCAIIGEGWSAANHSVMVKICTAAWRALHE
jgi:hypothetical protein